MQISPTTFNAHSYVDYFCYLCRVYFNIPCQYIEMQPQYAFTNFTSKRIDLDAKNIPIFFQISIIIFDLKKILKNQSNKTIKLFIIKSYFF